MRINIFKKFFRNIFDLKFSKDFMDEHIGNVFTYMLIGFIIINIFTVLSFNSDVSDFDEDGIDFVHSQEGVGINYILIDKIDVDEISNKMNYTIELYIFMGYMIVLEFIVVVALSIMASILAYIIKMILKKQITVLECVKAGMYSITIPNLLLAFQFLTSYTIPLFPLIYLAITLFYLYKYLTAFEPYIVDNIDMMGIMSNRVKDENSK